MRDVRMFRKVRAQCQISHPGLCDGIRMCACGGGRPPDLQLKEDCAPRQPLVGLPGCSWCLALQLTPVSGVMSGSLSVPSWPSLTLSASSGLLPKQPVPLTSGCDSHLIPAHPTGPHPPHWHWGSPPDSQSLGHWTQWRECSRF